MPLTLAYTAYACWVFRGKVAKDIQAGGYGIERGMPMRLPGRCFRCLCNRVSATWTGNTRYSAVSGTAPRSREEPPSISAGFGTQLRNETSLDSALNLLDPPIFNPCSEVGRPWRMQDADVLHALSVLHHRRTDFRACG